MNKNTKIGFMILAIFLITSLGTSKNALINNREEALDFYKKKYGAINPYSKTISFHFARADKITNKDLEHLKYFPDLSYISLGGENITDDTLEFLKDKTEL
jgi:hypothetical protein